MKLLAIVAAATGKTKHSIADVALGKPRELSSAKRIEIVDEGDGVYLYRYDAADQMIADTWHEDVNAAKRQAEFEFGVEGPDWIEKR